MLTHLQPAVGLLPTAVAAGAVATLRQLARGPFSTALLYQQQLGSWLGGSQRGHQADASVKDAESKAPEKLKQHIKDFAKLPWEQGMPPEKAASVLGSFLGVPNLEPAAVIDLNVDSTEALLHATTVKGDKNLEKAMFAHADAVTSRFFGDKIYYRGIVEFSNVCANDCGYCGIRKHQPGIHRYTMPVSEVVEVARWAFTNKMGTLMLQGGELHGEKRMRYLEEMAREVRMATVAQDLEARGLPPGSVSLDEADAQELGLCVAMSAGELSEEEYKRLFDAGARRYLLRIETSNPELYHMLHPSAMSWEKRRDCLLTLKKLGFQVGSGGMVGLPGQTLRDIAGDIIFFREIGADMIGIGPYITEPDTPVAAMWQEQFGSKDKKQHMKDMFELTTRVNALVRIATGNVNIAATTALQAIDPMGREIALRRGSNILMPILTPTKYREHYQLYEGKPCITDSADECRKCLNARISMIGKKLKDGAWGDPPHFIAPVVGTGLPGSMPSVRTYSSTAGPSSHSRSYNCSSSSSAAQPMPATSEPAKPKATGPAAGSDVPRINIGVFGVMNAGKSTLMNAITRQQTSIVDSTPGTTADVKATLMELHEVGPAKLFDTAGIDEQGLLGEKKRSKTLSALKECDVAVLVVDVARHLADPSLDIAWEKQLLAGATKYGAVPLLLYNLKGSALGAASRVLQRLQAGLDPEGAVASLVLDLHDGAQDVAGTVAGFLQEGVKSSRGRAQVKSLPEWALAPNATVFLNIPMDAETPTMRLLRPQALVQEEAIRHWSTTVGYRMDLAAARGADPGAREAERQRFLAALKPLLAQPGPKLLVTDSQAMDVVHPWTLDEAGNELLPITTFSIAMAHRQSGGKLAVFVEGLRALRKLQAGDKVLISEACNHNRITDNCNDIGMVQIPNFVHKLCGPQVAMEHAFGREYPEVEHGALGQYKVAIHCGGCMIDQQKMRARLMDLEEAGVPITNYGLFLSWVHAPGAVQRALKPWGVPVEGL